MEIFLTAQGEGANIGRTAVFLRFASCNLWSGREKDRADAICQFCDTDFVGGSRFADAAALADQAAALWPDAGHRFTVLTGGEPLLQVDAALLAALRSRGFSIAVETNGTQALPGFFDKTWGIPVIEVSATTNVECSHRDTDGRIHGHSYIVEVWVPAGSDQPSLAAAVREIAGPVDHAMLEDSIGSPLMEDMALWFLNRMPSATRVVVRRPTLGFAAEQRR